MEHDLTRGNVLKTIAVFALPYMLSYFLQMLYGMADLYMMGQFSGAAGITAVGNGETKIIVSSPDGKYAECTCYVGDAARQYQSQQQMQAALGVVVLVVVAGVIILVMMGGAA